MTLFKDQLSNLLKLIDYKINNKALSPNITLKEVYDKWLDDKKLSITKQGIRNYRTVWNKIPDKLKKKKFIKLKRSDWQNLINTDKIKGNGHYSQKRIKNLCGQLYIYAIRNELVYTNIAPTLELTKNTPVYEKTIFTDEEIQTLYENRDLDDMIAPILVLIFTGLRISEFLRLNPHEDIFLDVETPYLIVRQSKTEAGRNRPIPIFDKILPFVKELVDNAIKNNREYILNNDFCGIDRPYNYSSFCRRYKSILKDFNMNHTIHETRHTFASILDGVNANEMAIKKLMGHSAQGVTKKVYTHKNINSLFEAMALLENNYLLNEDEIEMAKQEIKEAIEQDYDFEISEPLKAILMRDEEFKFLGQKRKKNHFIRKIKKSA